MYNHQSSSLAEIKFTIWATILSDILKSYNKNTKIYAAQYPNQINNQSERQNSVFLWSKSHSYNITWYKVWKGENIFTIVQKQIKLQNIIFV